MTKSSSRVARPAPSSPGSMRHRNPSRTSSGPYTPRHDLQSISDDAELAHISARIGCPRPPTPFSACAPAAGRATCCGRRQAG
ncbi:MAG: hypothetical protein QOG20_6323 [Pseudonocardiales bacterium]|jgi:hypothetical protein|nr:hypothetical protein [Pseudonocardiales bacterium]